MIRNLIGAHVPIISDADVVYPDKAMITKEMIRNAEKVKLFRYGAGCDIIDIEAVKERFLIHRQGATICFLRRNNLFIRINTRN